MKPAALSSSDNFQTAAATPIATGESTPRPSARNSGIGCQNTGDTLVQATTSRDQYRKATAA